MRNLPLTLLAASLLALSGAACDRGEEERGKEEERFNYLDEAENEENAFPELSQGLPADFGGDAGTGNPACPTPRAAAECAQNREVWAKIPNVAMCCRYDNPCQMPNPEWAAFGNEEACEAQIGL